MTLPTDLIAYTRAMLLPALGRCRCGNALEPGQTECRACYDDAKGPFQFEESDE